MKRHLIELGTLACLLAVPAVAQDQPAQQRSPFTPPAVSAGANVGGVQAGVQANVSQDATVTTTPIVLNVSGTTLMDQTGQQLGQIQNLLVTPGGCVDLAVLSLGGTKLVPIPWQLVTSSGSVGGNVGAQARVTALTAKVDRQKIQQAPSFSINQLTLITQKQTIDQVYNFYGVQPQNVGGTSSQTSGVSGGSSSTNSAGFGTTSASTNQFGFSRTNQFGTTNSGTLSPTGQTNGYPNRPSFGTSTNTNTFRPPSAIPGTPDNRPPANRPPQNRPPSSPAIPGQGQQGQQ